jgi:hypothetical protein
LPPRKRSRRSFSPEWEHYYTLTRKGPFTQREEAKVAAAFRSVALTIASRVRTDRHLTHYLELSEKAPDLTRRALVGGPRSTVGACKSSWTSSSKGNLREKEALPPALRPSNIYTCPHLSTHNPHLCTPVHSLRITAYNTRGLGRPTGEDMEAGASGGIS